MQDKDIYIQKKARIKRAFLKLLIMINLQC
jgi:hypothetical protein